MTSNKIDDVNSEKLISNNSLVIVGAGIGGLVTALTVLMKYDSSLHTIDNIVILEKRAEIHSAIRPQIVHLNKENISFFNQFLEKSTNLNEEDIKFLTAIEQSNEHIALKDIQKFIKRRISEYSNCPLSILYESTLSQADFKNGKITVETTTAHGVQQSIILCKYLVVADGSNSPTLKTLTEAGFPEVYQKKFESKFKHLVNGTFIVKRKDNSQFALPNEKVFQIIIPGNNSMHYLAGIIYWNRSSWEKSHEKSVKIFITMGIPLQIYQKFQKNINSSIPFLRQCAQYLYKDTEFMVEPVKPSAKAGLAKDNLKFQTFLRDFCQAKSPIFTQDQIKVIPIGNAFVDPDFLQGAGANFAISQGFNSGLLITGQNDEINYIKTVNENAERHLEQTKDIEFFCFSGFNENLLFSLFPNSPIKEECNISLENKELQESFNQLHDKHRALIEARKKVSPNDPDFSQINQDISIIKEYINLFERYNTDINALAASLQAYKKTTSAPQFFQSSDLSIFLNTIKENIELIRQKNINPS